MPPPDPILNISGISKSFGGNLVLRNVSAAAQAGEVLALLGHNGAGKSTLIKILAGVLKADQGRVLIHGEPLDGSVRAAQAAGVAVIYQDLSLFPKLSVAENIAGDLAGKTFYSSASAREQSGRALARLGYQGGLERFLQLPVGGLSLAMQQQVAIARALARDAKILILDEPTASLAAKEAERLLQIIRELAARGVAVIFVSHRMVEVRAIAQRFLVLRNGAVTLFCASSDCTDRDLTKALFGESTSESTEESTDSAIADSAIGRSVRRESRHMPDANSASVAAEHGFSGKTSETPIGDAAAPLFEAEGCTRKGEFEDISFQLHGGEVVVLTGLVGSGRTEFAQSVFGLRRLTHGSIRIAGRKLMNIDPRSAVAAGLAYLPEDRQREGLFLDFSVRDNLDSAILNHRANWGLLRQYVSALEAIRSFAIHCKDPESPVWRLSGGNQQKVLFAKWMEAAPQVIFLDEPTTGVDVAAKSEIHRRIRALVEAGKAVLVISSDLDEVLELADRVLVFHNGRMVLDRSREAVDRQILMQSMLGIADASNASPAQRTPQI